MLLMGTVETAPAGGAAATQVLVGGLVSVLIMGAAVTLGLAHRAGRTDLLDRAAAPLKRVFALPGWALVPVAIALPAFAAAGFGFVWDVSIHIDQGRDTGPFGTPAHYFMLAGIYGFVAAGFIAIAMPREDPKESWVRVAHNWYAPVSAVIMLGAGFFSMLGFPMDDVWHRLFGQDVTLWGPTHQMMICGGVLNFFALMMLVREGRAAMRARGPRRRSFETARAAVSRAGIRVSGVIGAAICLTALTIAWQQEFAYGVPQFRLLFQPLLITLSGALVLVAARASLRRGAALATAVVSCIITGSLTLAVGPIVGSSTHHFPLYLAAALLVEAVAFTGLRGYAFGALAGAAVAVGGVPAEWGWSHIWMPIPWPSHLIPEAILRSLPVGIGAGIIGAFVAAALALPAGELVRRSRAGLVPALALSVVVLSLAALIPTHAPSPRIAVALTDLSQAPRRTVAATVRLKDGGDPDWLVVLGWQGKEHRHVVDNLRRVAAGVYRSTEPLPLYGSWKTAVRYARGSEMGGVLMYAPADRAIPAPAVSAPAHFERAMGTDRSFLQRERRHDVPGWLFSTATIMVALMVLALLAVFGWALVRIARGGDVPVSPSAERRSAETVRPTAPAVSVPH
jgi:hypothetical protein